MIKAVIFDFDGVLVDTERTTFDYFKKVLSPYGIPLKEEHFKYKVGRKSIDFFKDVMEDKYDPVFVEMLIQQKRKAFEENIKKYLIPIPGAFAFLEKLSQKDIIMAIGSQNEKPVLEAAVDAFHIRKYFKTIISLQDIKNKKPNPEIFLLVAEKLGIKPEESVVLEDSPVGIEAARKGGFKTVGITTSITAESLGADLSISSLAAVDESALLNL